MRRVRTVVLPVPAPAMMSSGPSPWSTASSWAGQAVEDPLLGGLDDRLDGGAHDRIL